MKYAIAVLIILLIWLTAGEWIINAKNRAVFALRRLLLPPENGLALENAALKAELLQLRQNIAAAPPRFITAKVYARYPFNSQNLLSVNKGARDGVRKGMTATIGGSLLIGKVEKVFRRYSLVKTIFTPRWKIPVRVGEQGIAGLFSGGPFPQIEMVAKNEKLRRGDAVFTAAEGFPYGLKIGEIGAVNAGAPSDIFQSAEIVFPYKSGNLTEIWLLK